MPHRTYKAVSSFTLSRPWRHDRDISGEDRRRVKCKDNGYRANSYQKVIRVRIPFSGPFPTSKIMKKKKEQQHRVSDFENAIKKSDLKIHISIVNYLTDSLYVKEIIGFVEQNNRGIRVTWNNTGEAYVANERTSEFDIKL